jgi:hypothetical protein
MSLIENQNMLPPGVEFDVDGGESAIEFDLARWGA